MRTSSARVTKSEAEGTKREHKITLSEPNEFDKEVLWRSEGWPEEKHVIKCLLCEPGEKWKDCIGKKFKCVDCREPQPFENFRPVMWDLCKRNLHKKSSHADELRCRKHQERPCPTTNCENMVSNRVNVYCDECVKVRPNHQAKGQNLQCGQCNASKPVKDFVRSHDEHLQWRGPGAKARSIYRCKNCVFPQCGGCNKIAAKPVSLSEFTKLDDKYTWYCDRKCLEAMPRHHI